jgi:multidrug efflux pump subunit AcrA (membrane-fusion protein)
VLWFASGVRLAEAEPIWRIEYPARVEAARHAALADLQARARLRSEWFEAQLADLQRQLVERFESRVQQTREQWQAALAQLAATVDALRAVEAQREAIEQVPQRFYYGVARVGRGRC